MKTKFIALFVFLVGITCRTNAYTREDLEKYRTINAIVSIGTIASAIDKSAHGFGYNRVLANASEVPLWADEFLSAALEKNRHLLSQIIEQINRIIILKSQGISVGSDIVMHIVQIALAYWLFDVIKKKYPLKEQETTRRKWRVFVRAAITTIFYGLDEQERQDLTSLFCSRMATFGWTFLDAVFFECIGSAIANSIEEGAQPIGLTQQSM